MWTSILGILSTILGVFFPKPPSDEAKAEATGEAAGRAKEQATNATASVNELERAQQGSQDAAAARSTDPDKLQRDGPDVRPYRPGGYD